VSQLEIDHDAGGYPILLAVRAPGQVAAQTTSGASVLRGARSGNANADPASGRFASGKRKKPGESIVDVNPLVVNRMGIPQGVTPEEWERRLDAIRDAAREFEEMGLGDAKEFLRGRVADLSKVDLEAFLAEVREQRIDDLIDVLDHQLRSQVVGNDRARRFVRLQAPRGFTKRLFASLTDDEVLKVATRLSNRGWDVDDLVDNVISRVNKQERRTALETKFRGLMGKTVKLADWGSFRPGMDGGLELQEEPEEPQQVHIEMPELPQQPTALQLADALGKVVEKMPVPHITVEAPQITVEAPRPVNKRVVRDADNHITEIINAET
jgi:hypothetical protein